MSARVEACESEGVHVVCMWYACMWEVAREAQGSLAAVGGLDGGRERTERLLLQLFI